MATFNIKFFTQVFITLLVIMDPLGNVPIFLSLTSGSKTSSQKKLAFQAVLVAGGVIGVFALFGKQILDYLGVTIPALQGSGGLLLLLVALELLTGQASKPTALDEVSVALVPLGTPLIAGPGAIAAIIVFVKEIRGGGDVVALVAAILSVLVILWLSLRFSLQLIKILKESGIMLLTRVFGLLLAAIAVQLVAEAVQGFIR
jgi:multiple antibiotic resistance protein